MNLVDQFFAGRSVILSVSISWLVDGGENGLQPNLEERVEK